MSGIRNVTYKCIALIINTDARSLTTWKEQSRIHNNKIDAILNEQKGAEWSWILSKVSWQNESQKHADCGRHMKSGLFTSFRGITFKIFALLLIDNFFLEAPYNILIFQFFKIYHPVKNNCNTWEKKIRCKLNTNLNAFFFKNISQFEFGDIPCQINCERLCFLWNYNLRHNYAIRFRIKKIL